MKPAFFLLVLLFAFSLHSQSDLVILQMDFLPPVFYVGDKVELRLKVSVDSEKQVRYPLSMPKEDWILLNPDSDMEVRQENREVFIRFSFIPYFVGMRTLPSIVLGDLVLSNIKIHTSSLLESSGIPLQANRNQMLIPQVNKLLIVLLLFAAALGALAYLFFRFIRIFFHQWMRMRQDKHHRRRSFQNLIQLRQKIETLDDKSFYSSLTGEIRRYLSYKLKTNFLSACTSEMKNLLSGKMEQQSVIHLISLFKFADLVKFGSLLLRKKDKTRHLKDVIQLMLHLDRKAVIHD